MPDGPIPLPKRQRRPRPHMRYEEDLRASDRARLIAGVDEAGRGPLAGPVVAAAVILPEDFTHPLLNDSKRLSARQRERIYDELTANPAIIWSCALVEPREIDRMNILRATNKAMRQAVRTLALLPDHALLDGLPIVPFPVPSTAIVKGDTLSMSIAAASIIAKVTRDRLMVKFDADYPGYGFAQHKGYPTTSHRDTLARVGPCPIHRFSFRPVGQPLLPPLAVAPLRRPR
jgi:ribonuclease HII